jgi:uncharacterized protein
MHSAFLRIYDMLENPLVTCEAVIVETLYLLQSLPSAQLKILSSIDQGILEIPFHLRSSSARVREIMEKYSDTPADFADACLIQMADELDTADILTLDSDFRHYRWRKIRPFNLLIPLA